jgi:hypothetical protein
MSAYPKVIAASIVGAAVGSVITYFAVKSKFETIANEEIEAAKERVKSKESPGTPKKPKTGTKTEKVVLDTEEYKMQVEKSGYTNYSGGTANAVSDEKPKSGRYKWEDDITESVVPYAISKESFNTLGYDIVQLVYYADKVLVDEVGDIVDICGDGDPTDSLAMPQEVVDTFGADDEDVAYARNDGYRIDYEITLDPRRYSDLPHPTPPTFV